jgi:glyoxylase-like metal-dependent hydrolase (beta-lactamase superfamily II)
MTPRLSIALVLALAASTSLATRAQQPPAAATAGGGVKVLPVQRAVSMAVTPGGNVALQIGDDGPLLVDSPAASDAGALVAAVRALSPRSVHTLITTNLHTAAGNAALVQARGTAPGTPAIRVIAHEKVLDRLVKAGPPAGAAAGGLRLNAVIELPINNTYFTPRRDFYLNGEAVVVYHAPAATTDGDSIVHFRSSDVVAVGDLFNPDVYPVIDVANGGTVNGLVAALNHILEITVPARFQEGGTYVIPRRGRLSDEAEVVEFRDMVTIVRDRVQDLIKKGRTLAQVQAARPTLDYDPEYGGTGNASPERFVESIFRSLSK